jgi:hypothetical protein
LSVSSNSDARHWSLQALPLWAAIVPLVTINLCYLIAVSLEHVPACIPYLSGCTSVSSTGRIEPESLIFKAGMLSSAVVLALVWLRCATFLQLGGQTVSRANVLRVLGLFAALSLTIYGVTLGLREDEYRVLRRISIDGFALSNVFVQITFIVLYRPMRIDATRTLFRWLLILCFAIPLIGIGVETAKWLGAPRRSTNNMFAWNSFVVVSAYYALIARIWWHHGFTSELSIKSSGRAASPSE